MIKKGEKFRCIKTLTFGPYVWYTKGKVYTSDMDRCITDDDGDVHHHWTEGEDLYKYFIAYVSNKRKGYGRNTKQSPKKR